jgi:ABC-2 type transport system permease protein
MRDIVLITLSSIRNNLKSKALTVVFIGITLMIALGLALFFCLLLIAPEMDNPAPDRARMETYLSLIMYTTCFICSGINLNVFAFQSMTREKSHGSIESLMATPVNINSIWIAKSLAVFIPGMVLGEVLSLAALLAVNFIYFVPVTGFIYSFWIGLNCFLVIPLIYLCMSFLAHIIGLTGKPSTSNVIVQIFLPAALSLMINLIIRQILDAASWNFTLAGLGISAVIIIAILILKPRITRERIVLSR